MLDGRPALAGDRSTPETASTSPTPWANWACSSGSADVVVMGGSFVPGHRRSQSAGARAARPADGAPAHYASTRPTSMRELFARPRPSRRADGRHCRGTRPACWTTRPSRRRMGAAALAYAGPPGRARSMRLARARAPAARMKLSTPRWWYSADGRGPGAGDAHGADAGVLDLGRRRPPVASPGPARRSPALPVICVGNLTVGGTGKTPVVRELLRRAAWPGTVLSRGYGGRLQGPLRVDPAVHTAAEVGDEPLMLARDLRSGSPATASPGRSPPRADGAKVLVMDDGHQNPSVRKTLSLVVVDGETRERRVAVRRRRGVPGRPDARTAGRRPGPRRRRRDAAARRP